MRGESQGMRSEAQRSEHIGASKDLGFDSEGSETPLERFKQVSCELDVHGREREAPRMFRLTHPSGPTPLAFPPLRCHIGSTHLHGRGKTPDSHPKA